MRLRHSLCAVLLGLLLSVQRVVAGDLLPDPFLGWFVPAPQSCGASDLITVSADRIVSGGGLQRITRVERTERDPRWVRVSLETIDGAGTEDVVMGLARDGLDLRVLFGDGTWLTWRRCL